MHVKSGSTANRTNREAVLPFCVTESVWNQAFFSVCQQADRHMRNHKGSLWKCGYRELFCGFRTLILTDFRPSGAVMRASHQVRPETLLAAVVAFPAGVVILPPTVLTQEERPFQPPFLASAHRQSCSGTSRSGFFPSGAYVQHTPVWCPPTSLQRCRGNWPFPADPLPYRSWLTRDV